MGVIVSYMGGLSQSNEPDPVTGLTPKEKQLVANSWNLVKKDLVNNGVKLFLIYFKDFPEYQSKFSFGDVQYDNLAADPKLKAHATSVMYALSSIIDNISNNDILINLLQKNGESHAKRNIAEKAYTDLKGCVIKLFEQELGSKFNKDTREAWNKTITVAFSVIIKSLKENRPPH